VAGYQGTNGNDFAILRYNSDGTLDTGWSEDGIQTWNSGGTQADQAYALAFDSTNNKLYVAGYTYNVDNYDFAILRYGFIFTAGKTVEDPSNQTDAITLNQYYLTEVEYVFQFTDNAGDGTTYCFRTTNAGTVLDNYLKVAEITTASAVNQPPEVTLVSLNNGLNIDLTESATVLVTSTATITDPDGYTDISSATGTIYRSGVIGGANCTADNNNCYKDTSCSLTNCSGNSCTAICEFNVWYYADPTVSGTPWAGEYWVASIGAIDSASNYDDATNTEETILMNDLVALSIIEPTGNLDFGQITAGQDTGTDYVTSTVAATGNVALDTEMSGEGLVRDGGTEMIDVQNQEYSTTTVPYETYGSGTSLTTSTVEFELELAKTTDHDSTSTDDIFWGLGIPSGIPAGTYYGTTTIAAVKDELPWPP